MNNIYDNARMLLSTAQLDWRAADLMLTAWGGEPLFDPAHRTIADLVATAGLVNLGESLPIDDPQVTFDGYNQTQTVVISGIPTGEQVTFMTMSDRNAVPELSVLYLFIDTVLGLPFIGNGLDVVVQPDWTQKRGWFRA